MGERSGNIWINSLKSSCNQTLSLQEGPFSLSSTNQEVNCKQVNVCHKTSKQFTKQIFILHLSMMFAGLELLSSIHGPVLKGVSFLAGSFQLGFGKYTYLCKTKCLWSSQLLRPLHTEEPPLVSFFSLFKFQQLLDGCEGKNTFVRF